jgi:uncharacterized membrane protein
VVGLFWLRHHEFFGRLQSSDLRLAGINLVFLAFIALLPVPTQLLGRYDNSASPVVIYAVVILVLTLLLRALFLHAERAGLMIEGQSSPSDPVGLAAVMLAFGASIPLAFVNPDWAMYCWILTAVIPRVYALTRSVRSAA